MTFSEFTYISILFSNDLKFAKLHASGYMADDIRRIADSLAVYTEITADEFSKLAIVHNEGVDSFSNVKNYIDESVWKPETDEIVTMDKFVNFLNTKGRDYLDAIKELKKNEVSEDNTPEKLAIEGIESFWYEEINFKNASRMITAIKDTEEPQGDAINPDTEEEFNDDKSENIDDNSDDDNSDDEKSEELPKFPASLDTVIKDYVSYMKDVTDKKDAVESTLDYVKKIVKDKD